MMEITDPLFNKKGKFVGWLLEYTNIFDKDLEWRAYVFNDFIWATETGIWIGELRGTNLLDRDGNIVAWSINGPIEGSLGFKEAPLYMGPPSIPVQPIIYYIPLNPGYAPEPLGTWSELSFNEWLNQR